MSPVLRMETKVSAENPPQPLGLVAQQPDKSDNLLPHFTVIIRDVLEI